METAKSIWKQNVNPENINRTAAGMVRSLDIKITAVGENFLEGSMPVVESILQPMGLVHGGAYCALAETLGSMAANLCLDPQQEYAVGIEINANHVRSIRQGMVFGKAIAAHLGKSTQVWNITITNELQQLVCLSRLTVMVKKK